ncbi:hypothetical protein [Candidatus Oscillochloris fontis]|uniref:hypothetical protein n=1 Tax=Candidatus Oscillochloris fontis TaxID=2496868 RepID=UPI0013758445|nr:hypothetical protein [Candidatus Oscillochloris fontis]
MIRPYGHAGHGGAPVAARGGAGVHYDGAWRRTRGGTGRGFIMTGHGGAPVAARGGGSL